MELSEIISKLTENRVRKSNKPANVYDKLTFKYSSGKVDALDGIAKLMKEKFTLKESVDFILENDKGSHLHFLRHLKNSQSQGKKISDSMIGWYTDDEVTLVRSGESDDIIDTLNIAVDFMKNKGTAYKTICKSFVSPLLYTVMLYGLFVGFYINMVPILTSLIPVEEWAANGQQLHGISKFLTTNWYFIISFVVAFIFILWSVLPVWTGVIRNKFNSLPIFKLYKNISVAMFLSSLSTLMKSNISLKDSLFILSEKSPRYVKNEVDIMIKNLGTSSSTAEILTKGVSFYSESVLRMIKISSKGSDLGDRLGELSDGILNGLISDVTSKSETYQTMFKMVLFGVIGFMVIAFYDITDSMSVESDF
jgi:type II secretory pathway component PulF